MSICMSMSDVSPCSVHACSMQGLEPLNKLTIPRDSSLFVQPQQKQSLAVLFGRASSMPVSTE